MNPDVTLESFVDKLLTEKQFSNLEPEVQAQLREDLLSRAQDHINAALLKELPSEKLTEFESMLDGGKTPEEIRAFLVQHIPELDQVVAASLIRFRNSYVSA